MRLLVIQHDHVSPPGPVGERFVDRGFDLEAHLIVPAGQFAQPNITTTFPDPTRFDAIMPMGAPWSVYDRAAIGAWVGPEIRLLQDAHQAGVPVLGICFGGQLLAQAHGGSVLRSSTPEIGWTRIQSDDEKLVPPGPWFQWHYDRWTLPPGAHEIARNARSSQAFRLGANLAVQFHPELSPIMLAGWLDNGGDRKAVDFGLDPERLRRETADQEEQARLRAHRLVDAFVDQVVTA